MTGYRAVTLGITGLSRRFLCTVLTYLLTVKYVYSLVVAKVKA